MRTAVLGLFFVLAFSQCKMREPVGAVKEIMTVMNIIPGTVGEEYDRVIFKLSARIFRISKKAKKEYHALLNESKEKGTPVVVTRKDVQSDVILVVTNP